MSTRPYVWAGSQPEVLDQMLVSLVDNFDGTATWIAECSVRQGCFAGSQKDAAEAVNRLYVLRESYDATFRKGSS